MIRRGLVCLVLALMSQSPASAQFTPAQERGRQIYFGEDGSALADSEVRIGKMGVKLPAQSFPCASCHGRKGGGVAERGAIPSDLSAGALTKPYSVTGAFGRRRPPYSLSSFRTVVRTGKDSGGNTLSEAMPRFELSDNDLSDVWAFLQVMADLREPGVEDDQLSVGVRLAAGGKSLSGQAQRRLLESLAGEINRIGGIHGRRLRFVYAASGSLDETVLFLGLDLDPLSGALPEALPVIAMREASTPRVNTFYLTAGSKDHAAALRFFAVRQFGAVSVKDTCHAAGGEVRFLSAPGCLEGLSGARRALIPHPVFISIPHADRRKLPEETYISLPAPIWRVSPQAQEAFARARAAVGNGRETVIAEADAYSSAALLIEALMRTGRDLTREDFVSTMESFSGFEGAMTPPVTFGPNRHTGSRGVEVVRYNPAKGEMETNGVWIDPDEE